MYLGKIIVYINWVRLKIYIAMLNSRAWLYRNRMSFKYYQFRFRSIVKLLGQFIVIPEEIEQLELNFEGHVPSNVAHAFTSASG
jgi:hypothetical protein